MTDVTNPDAGAAGDGTAPPEPNVEELRQRAKDLDVRGRSSMNRDELIAAITTAEAARTLRTPFARTMQAQEVRAGLEAGGAFSPGAVEDVGREDLVEVARARAANRNPRRVGA